MIKFGFIIIFQVFSNDSTTVLSDTIMQPPSVVFKTSSPSNINTEHLRYKYRQGFFCDFEDKINQGKKLRLNLGVGEN
jgi:hypothetical protein